MTPEFKVRFALALYMGAWDAQNRRTRMCRSHQRLQF